MKLQNAQDRARFIAANKLPTAEVRKLEADISMNSLDGITTIQTDKQQRLGMHLEAVTLELEDAEQKVARLEVAMKNAHGTAEMYRKAAEQIREQVGDHQIVGMFAAQALPGVMVRLFASEADDLAREAMKIGLAMAKAYRAALPETPKPSVDEPATYSPEHRAPLLRPSERIDETPAGK